MNLGYFHNLYHSFRHNYSYLDKCHRHNDQTFVIFIAIRQKIYLDRGVDNTTWVINFNTLYGLFFDVQWYNV